MTGQRPSRLLLLLFSPLHHLFASIFMSKWLSCFVSTACFSLFAQCQFLARAPVISLAGAWPNSSTSTCSSSRTSSESGLPSDANTWSIILDLSFHGEIEEIFLDFRGWTGAKDIPGTCQFSMLLALVRRSLIRPIYTSMLGP